MKTYKPNVVYILEIDKDQYYVGCQCRAKKIYESEILNHSGNSLNVAHCRGQISLEEYKRRCKVIHIEDYDSKELAQLREASLIQQYKEKYGEACLNIGAGNIYNKSWGLKAARPILQYDKQGNLIKEYASITEAAKITGIGRTQILGCCKNRRKSAGGYHWAYQLD